LIADAPGVGAHLRLRLHLATVAARRIIFAHKTRRADATPGWLEKKLPAKFGARIRDRINPLRHAVRALRILALALLS